jgi:hypothetical protein
VNKLDIYDKLKIVPESAKKPIGGGRLKGMTDINPMWRIKAMTEQFGPCGMGWYYTIEKQWLEHGDGAEQKAFCNINLYYKVGEVWSMAIPGTGGSDFVVVEKNGPFTSDECFKMALTDALSVAMKSIGVGADVYFEKDRTKYDAKPEGGTPKKEDAPKSEAAQTDKIDNKKAYVLKLKAGDKFKTVLDYYKVTKAEDLTMKQWSQAMKKLEAEAEKVT